MSTDIGTEAPPDATDAPTSLEPTAAAEPSDGGDGAPPDATSDPQVPRRRRRWPWVVAGTLLFALMVAGGAVAGGTMSYADSLAGRLLPGTVVAGVDVSGMTRDQAVAAVKAELAPQLSREVTVRWRDQRWRATVRQLGGFSNAEDVVAEVATAQAGLEWADWARLRWLGESRGVTAGVDIAHRRARVRAFVERIAAEVEREPVDAELTVNQSSVEITPERVGFAVARKPTVRGIMRRLRGDTSPVRLDVQALEPARTEAAFRQVLLLDQSDHRLTLFVEGRTVKSWIVATGTGEFPTPLGRYHITLKRYMPTWVNPSPDGWGKDLPAEIPPGPGNPLGVRALNWDAPAIRFHGTQAVDTLGTDASHGCVRMSNGDVMELFELVDVGAVIVSRV